MGDSGLGFSTFWYLSMASSTERESEEDYGLRVNKSEKNPNGATMEFCVNCFASEQLKPLRRRFSFFFFNFMKTFQSTKFLTII